MIPRTSTGLHGPNVFLNQPKVCDINFHRSVLSQLHFCIIAHKSVAIFGQPKFMSFALLPRQRSGVGFLLSSIFHAAKTTVDWIRALVSEYDDPASVAFWLETCATANLSAFPHLSIVLGHLRMRAMRVHAKFVDLHIQKQALRR